MGDRDYDFGNWLIAAGLFGGGLIGVTSPWWMPPVFVAIGAMIGISL